MGILNITPDSFADGGKFLEPQAAVARAFEMASQGADLVDIGGESSRPGAVPVSADEELRRVMPVLEALISQKFPLPISIDTCKARVAHEALMVGAVIINDISCFADSGMPAVVREFGAGLVLMHMQGNPETMQQHPRYKDVVGDIRNFLEEKLKLANQAGILAEQIVVDPGIGFGKTVEHNLEILARLREFRSLGRPILVGPSRKSFIGKTLAPDLSGKEVADAIHLGGTAAAVAQAVANGACIVRVHDVGVIASMVRMLAVLQRMEE